jgi:hypothetical protein
MRKESSTRPVGRGVLASAALDVEWACSRVPAATAPRALTLWLRQWYARTEKGFVRMRIAPTGQLSIYPIKVARVCRAWQADPDGAAGAPWLRPLDPLRTELIEDPITIGRC